MKTIVVHEFYLRMITGLILGLIGIFVLFFAPSWLFATIVALVLMRILFIEWPRLLSYKDPLFWGLMPFYPVLPMILIIIMQTTGYEVMNILTFSMVGALDAGSYIIGKRWGTYKIYPDISPKKTWEGFVGGATLAFAFSLIFFGHNDLKTFVFVLMPFTLLVCLSALAGDLFESALKRRAGIKDTGSVLPGHGGILDRIDGVLFATFIIFILKDYLRALLSSVI